AVQLLAHLEGAPRGLYSGCFGIIDPDQAELAMSIRGIELRSLGRPEQLALIGAGGGITADSVAEAELAEKDLKARPLLAALQAALRAAQGTMQSE
ncbi:MAG: anthranilate synthase component I family protein, partial [Leucobacter sp.]|nr:anthranilate synthase component I family protein [Leucobacter sp.]